MISQQFLCFKNLSFVGEICNFEGALSLPIHSRRQILILLKISRKYQRFKTDQMCLAEKRRLKGASNLIISASNLSSRKIGV
jgi:hypothetical protein